MRTGSVERVVVDLDKDNDVDVTHEDKTNGACVFPPGTNHYLPSINNVRRGLKKPGSEPAYTQMSSNAIVIIPRKYGGDYVLVPEHTLVRISETPIISFPELPGFQLIDAKERVEIEDWCNKDFNEWKKDNRRKENLQARQYYKNDCFNQNIYRVGHPEGFIHVAVKRHKWGPVPHNPANPNYQYILPAPAIHSSGVNRSPANPNYQYILPDPAIHGSGVNRSPANPNYQNIVPHNPANPNYQNIVPHNHPNYRYILPHSGTPTLHDSYVNRNPANPNYQHIAPYNSGHLHGPPLGSHTNPVDLTRGGLPDSDQPPPPPQRTEEDDRKDACVVLVGAMYHRPPKNYKRPFRQNGYTDMKSDAIAAMPDPDGRIVLIPEDTPVRISGFISLPANRPGSRIISKREKEEVEEFCKKDACKAQTENRREKSLQRIREYLNDCFNKNIYRVGHPEGFIHVPIQWEKVSEVTSRNRQRH
ncbi:hypothetical protein APHAL10511_005482 [Amanita phalloides]|nr:hypothetical protein APHAL10511_005482 [Amanita phalloides]